MTTRMILSLGLSALVMGGSMVGCTANGGGIASASDRSGPLAARGASEAAAKAGKALAKGDAVKAVGFAEAAVAASPRSAAYRALLGQSYLQAGRFQSANDALRDALVLAPEDGKVALNLALAQVATGDWHAARATLDTHASVIPAADRGLALALAGNPAGGVAVLTEVVRSPGSSAKVRQNLALSLALAGQWQAARVVAATDLAPDDVDERLQHWASFAQPNAASDQVASLLGVRAVADRGQPVALALNASVPVMPVQAAPLALAGAETRVKAEPATATATGVTFGPRRAVVQMVPAAILRAPRTPVKVAAVDPAPSERPVTSGGRWYVQLGAFDNAGVARDAWGRAARRFAGFAGHAPNGMTFRSKAGEFYRLSVGGFSRGDADSVCRRYRASGGACFVRMGAGDRMAQWVRTPGVQMASR